MAAFEPFIAARHIRTRLIQSAALVALQAQRVYRDVAPSDATYPLTIMTLVSAEDVMVVGDVRIWSNQLWQVEFWSKTNDDAVIAQGATLIDVALHGVSGVLTGATYGNGLVLSSTRERALSLPATVDGTIIYRRGGGEYRQNVKGA